MTAALDEELVTLPDGTRMKLRPIRESDAAALQDFVAHRLAPEDVRLRFLAPIRELSPGLLRRLTHPDPQGEVAIVVELADTSGIVAVGRLGAEQGSRSVEYAIVVRTDMQHHGIGHMLMSRLVQSASRLGYEEIFGLVLRENHRMLQIARESGFTAVDEPTDSALVRVARRLP